MSVGPDKANDYSFTAWSHWQRIYGSQIKKRQAKPNPNDSGSRTLSVGPNMANEYSFTALSHWQRIYGSQIKKKDRLSLTLMTYDLKPCQFIPIWLMPLHLEHCHTGNVIIVAKKKRQTKLTLMTSNWEPCQLVPIWLMPLH